MTSSRSQGAEMITTDCPWCEATAEITPSGLHCPGCDVVVEIADDVRELQLAA
jgi:hypothetical protein